MSGAGKMLSSLSELSLSVLSTQTRFLHANRSQICRVKRPKDEYCRQFPVKIVFQDGSTITTRHQVPREIIKLPFLLENCKTEAERKQWLGRRKPKEVIEIKKDETDVRFNQMQYLKNMKISSKKGAADKKSSRLLN